MTTVSTAIELAENGFEVFPLKPDGKPYTENGFKDATDDVRAVTDAWEKHPNALIGVFTGGSGLIVLDLDYKVSEQGDVLVDGFESLAEAWLEVPDTFAYDSRNGLGRHLVYRAPEGNFPRSMGYRGMKGVDRCSGNGYVAWMGGVPADGEIADAPEWLLDQKEARSTAQYEGTLKSWYEDLTPGEPNALVRKAMERATQKFEELGNDFSHSDFVELQFELVRLGAEGNPGVPEALDHLEELFMSREGAHSRPEEEWNHEWSEALQSAIEKYGDAIDLLKSLPEYNVGILPEGINDGDVLRKDTGKPGFSKLLAALVKATDDDLRITSILWNCPATTALAREWGLEFVHKRVQDARVKPEPTRENPRLEEVREMEHTSPELASTELLTPEEREYISKRPTFVDHYLDAASQGGFVNKFYARSSAWNVASLAFAFHGFIPQDEEDNMGLNLWTILLGESSTGKTRSAKFEKAVLDTLFQDEAKEEGAPSYYLGAGSSPEGVHEALLLRDRLATMFFQDEASEFFSKLKPSSGKGWMSGFTDALARYYEGDVPSEQKVRLKELRGKSAMTALNLHMFATPDRFLGLIERDMFGTGFVPRINWVIAPPPVMTSDRFKARQAKKGRVTELGQVSEHAKLLAADLLSARTFTNGKPVPLFATEEALDRMSQAQERMYRVAEARDNWDIMNPVVIRLFETLRKCAGICAMYRSDSEIILEDVLHALNQVEEWFENAFKVANLVSEGDFQRTCRAMEEWVKGRKGQRASRTEIFHKFGNVIMRDTRELDNYLSYLVESGAIVRDDTTGAPAYVINGGG